MNAPKISVIVPVYKVEPYIEACIRSILVQTFQDYEIILVDDGSPDGSIEIAEKLLASSNVVYRILHQENQGQGAAREAGIQAATGEWISCIDSDDYVDPIFLETLFHMGNSYRVPIAVVSYQMIYDVVYPSNVTLAKDEGIMERREVLHNFLVRQFRPVLPGMLINRHFLEENKIKNDVNCRFSEDLYYCWQLFWAAERIAVSNLPLYQYLIRSGSIMTASRASDILTGYQALQRLSEAYKKDTAIFPEIRYLLPRWVLGALRSAARIAAYPDFLGVAEGMDWRAAAKELAGFPEWKARALALALRIHPRLFYAAARLAG